MKKLKIHKENFIDCSDMDVEQTEIAVKEYFKDYGNGIEDMGTGYFKYMKKHSFNIYVACYFYTFTDEIAIDAFSKEHFENNYQVIE